MKIQADVCKQIAKTALSGRWIGAMTTGLVASFLGVFTNLVSGVLKIGLLSIVFITLFERVPLHLELTILLAFVLATIWFMVGSYIHLGHIDYNLAILDQRGESGTQLFGSSASWFRCIELRVFIMLATCIGCMFFLIPGMIIYYTYAMAPFLLEEQGDLTVAEALALSRQKMSGNRFQFFLLRLSFLGWNIFGILTLGLGFLYVHPYYAMSEAVFFNEVSGRAEALYERH